jgi:hypothetical protein
MHDHIKFHELKGKVIKTIQAVQPCSRIRTGVNEANQICTTYRSKFDACLRSQVTMHHFSGSGNLQTIQI